MPNALPNALLLAASEATESHHSNPLAPEVNELIWGAVCFVILFAVLAKFVFPSVNKMFEERTANIEGKLQEAERERQRADQLIAANEVKMREANSEAARIIENARTSASRLETELKTKAEEDARRIIERAQEHIDLERDRAMQSLRSEVGGLAVDLAERVVAESLDRDRHLRLVDQYISELSSQQRSN